MTQSKFLIRTSGALALVALLSACGGSNTPEPDPEPPTTTPEPPPPASVESLSLAIQTAENDAMAANKMAADALKSAMKYDDMLTTLAAAGDSGAAMMAAQAILDAEMDVGTALSNAEDALADAKAAKMDVMALADDHPHKATLMTSVDRVVEMAEMYVDTIKGISTGTELEGAVAEVEGTNEKGTPRSIANTVGTDIAGALALSDAPAAGNLSGARVAHGTTAPVAADVAAALRHVTDDAKGMTWAELVGEDNLMTMPIGTDRAGVSVASIDGMAVAKVWATESDRPADGADIADGALQGIADAANYMGIPGTAYCLGTDCKVAGGKLMGSWYFAQTAANSAVHYVRNTDRATRDATPYVAETLYAQYGHWLTETGGDWTVNTFATAIGQGTDGAYLGLASAQDGIDDGDKASYSGGAVGMSSRTQGSGDSKTTDSGRFTASVKLNAAFGAAPTVTGTINNFQGDAVNSGWSVSLGEATLAQGTQNQGTAVTGGRDGMWSAQAYGTSGTERPRGIYGGFAVHFSDGDAAGAYATRAD